MPAFNVIDRRLNPRDKSLPNRQRFKRLVRSQLREKVRESIATDSIQDINSGKKFETKIPIGDKLREPRFQHDSKGGNREHVLPGNKEYIRGDTLPKPKQGQGGAGKEGSPDGEGEDLFSFTLTPDEYYDILFEELELPDMAKTVLGDMAVTKPKREGHSTTGATTNLDVIRTMIKAIGRRLTSSGANTPEMKELKKKIFALENKSNRTPEDNSELIALHKTWEEEAGKKRRAYLDPTDLSYRRFAQKPEPKSQAVMFCLMDVSGSMTENMKDLAKRFFLLLHVFLSRKYEHIEIVFIRHTDKAQVVDEETFFRSKETGGTIVSSALLEMKRLIAEKYSPEEWNIYAAQASDGDNAPGDKLATAAAMQEILPLTRHFAYIEVHDERQTNKFGIPRASDLWKLYQEIQATAQFTRSFAMRVVENKSQIFPVFHDLFNRNRNQSRQPVAALALG